MERGAWPCLVGGVICLVNSVNERDLNLLTRDTKVRVGRVSPCGVLDWLSQFFCRHFLEELFTHQVNGSLRQQQVCDALRCFGLHAHYTDLFNESLNLVLRDRANFESKS